MANFLRRFRRREHTPACSAVVVAAGSARRMEGVDKVLQPLGEVPVLVRSIRPFQQCSAVTEIVVVTREDLLVEVGRLCRDFGLDKVRKVVTGGETRPLSVRAGLRETDREAELIAIHDGARPLLTLPVLERALAQAARTGAAAPAVAVNDTLKRVGEGELVEETVDRGALRAVQTPQIFQADLIRAAVEKAAEDGVQLTDECAAVERLGMKVVLTQGDRENIKVTTPFDLVLGEAILTARGE